MKKRNSAIELLRILSMFLIIYAHYSIHGAVDVEAMDLGLNKVLLQVALIGNMGVALFVMITGYFMVTSEFKLRKLITILAQVIFYTVSIYLIECAVGSVTFSITDLAKNFMPCFTVKYWFFTVYILVYIFSTYLNLMIKHASKKQLAVLVIFGFILWSVLPSLFGKNLYGAEVTNFFLLYIIGAYIRLYGDSIQNAKKKGILLFLATMVMIVICTLLGDTINIPHINSQLYSSSTAIFAITGAVGLLIFAINTNMGNIKFINAVAACTFGIYLIHDNMLVRRQLWKDLLQVEYYQNTKMMPLHFIASGLLVFVICCLVEMLRKNIIERYFEKAVDSIFKVFSKQRD